MAIYLTDVELEKLISFEDALDLTQAALQALAAGSASNHPRVRIRAGKAALNVLVSGYPDSGFLGFKAYSGASGHFNWLYSVETGKLVAVLQAGWLGWIRTSAASAVAARLLARPDARVAAFLGAGRQAEGQLRALRLVRELVDIRCFSPSGASAERLAETGLSLGLNARAVASAEEAVAGADLVTTATQGRAIALQGRWLAPGAHVNAMGVNHGGNREIDEEAVLRADVITVDEKENARIEAGDLLPVIAAGKLGWDRVFNIGDVLNGAVSGRTSVNQITLFESQGLGVEDIAVSAVAYERALAAGVGQQLPF